MLPYLQAGLDVDGCDYSKDMLAQCQERAKAEGLSPRLYEQAMHELDLPRRYRTIFCCGVVGLGGERQLTMKAMQRGYEHLEPGGRFAFDYSPRWNDPPAWLSRLPEGRRALPQEWPSSTERKLLADGCELELVARTIAMDPLEEVTTRQIRARLWRNDELLKEEIHTQKLEDYSKHELVLMLEHAGFGEIEIRGDYSDEPATADHKTLVFVARKQGTVPDTPPHRAALFSTAKGFASTSLPSDAATTGVDPFSAARRGLGPACDIMMLSPGEALKIPYVAIRLERNGEGYLAAAFGDPQDDLLSFPLVYQEETIGSLQLVRRAPGEEFSRADRQLLENIAQQAGAAAQSVRLHTQLLRSRAQIVNEREEERRRIRRDLHDELGLILASQGLKLAAARQMIRTAPEKAESLVDELAQQSQETVGEIRRLVRGLRPPALDQLGLVEAVRDHIRHAGSDGFSGHGLAFDITAPEEGLPELPVAVEG